MIGVASNATTIAADGNRAIGAIMRLVGVDKQSEDSAASRLAPPLKALPPPLKLKEDPWPWEPSLEGDLDDEIPF